MKTSLLPTLAISALLILSPGARRMRFWIMPIRKSGQS